MAIEFSGQDIMVIYEHMKVELAQLEILSAVKPNPIHENSYRQHTEVIASITEKIEAVYPNFLETSFQSMIKEKADKKLLKGN